MVDVVNIKPERDFVVETTMTIEEVRRRYQNDLALTGKAKSYSLEQCHIVVDLGNNIEGILPINEISLDEIKNNGYVPAQVKTIMRKPAIRVKVTWMEDGVIYLSRRENLLDAFRKIEKLGKVFYMSTVENITQYNIFFDLGEGLTASCNIKDLSKMFLDDARDWVTVGKHIRVRAVKFNHDEKLVWCSVKKAYQENYNIVQPKKKTIGRLGKCIRDEDGHVTGYFVEITPAICGIVDVRDEHFPSSKPEFGKYYRFYVRSVDKRKHRVKLFFE